MFSQHYSRQFQVLELFEKSFCGLERQAACSPQKSFVYFALLFVLFPCFSFIQVVVVMVFGKCPTLGRFP